MNKALLFEYFFFLSEIEYNITNLLGKKVYLAIKKINCLSCKNSVCKKHFLNECVLSIVCKLYGLIVTLIYPV